jgi:aminodeoxyfutalosine deaminase
VPTETNVNDHLGDRAAAAAPTRDTRDLASLPKVELHVHLEGTIDAATAAALARHHGEDPAQVLLLEDDGYPARYRDLAHFVAVFTATAGRVRTPDDLAAVAAAFARGQAAQHVRYTEATFTPLMHVDNGMEPGPMWQAIRDGFAEAPDVDIALICDTVRDLGPEGATRLVALVEAADAPVVGLGLTGTEGAVPEAAFVALREAADRLELGLTVHAGESGGPANVVAALDTLGADRIGHGIASVGDPALVERLVRERVPLEVCPTSNVRLGLADDLDAHPIVELLQAGVRVVVGSDDPPFFGTTLTDELAHVVRLAGLTRRDLAGLQRRAVEVSFAPAGLRTSLLQRIDAWDAASTL